MVLSLFPSQRQDLDDKCDKPEYRDQAQGNNDGCIVQLNTQPGEVMNQSLPGSDTVKGIDKNRGNDYDGPRGQKNGEDVWKVLHDWCIIMGLFSVECKWH
jgi:hypothetical protein